MNEEEIIIYLTNQNKKLKEEICSLKNKIKEIDNTRAYWHIKNDDKKDKIKQLQNNWNELNKFIEEEKNRLATQVSNTYEDSLGERRFVNEDIFNELTKVSEKMQELGNDKEC